MNPTNYGYRGLRKRKGRRKGGRKAKKEQRRRGGRVKLSPYLFITN